MCTFNQRNSMFQPTYRPIEAALLWCELHQHQEYIINAAWGSPHRLTQCLRYWPDLDRRFQKIMDAVIHSELPSILSDFHVPLAFADNCMHVKIRHVELQRWMIRYYPDQRPSFLFNSGPSCPFSEELSSTLLRRIDSLNTRYQLDQEEISQLKADLAVASQQLEAIQRQLDLASIPNEKRRSNYERTIGAVVELLRDFLTQAANDTRPATQDAIVTLIETRYPNTQGLSRRSLQTRLKESLRTLNEGR